MAVKFLMSHTVGTQYNKGEIAGFAKEVEADLIERKIAERFTAPPKEPAKPAGADQK